MKKPKPLTSVVIKDSTGTVLFQKDFIYPNKALAYFQYMIYKTQADHIRHLFIGSDGKLIEPYCLTVIKDIDNVHGQYEVAGEAYINKQFEF